MTSTFGFTLTLQSCCGLMKKCREFPRGILPLRLCGEPCPAYCLLPSAYCLLANLVSSMATMTLPQLVGVER